MTAIFPDSNIKQLCADVQIAGACPSLCEQCGGCLTQREPDEVAHSPLFGTAVISRKPVPEHEAIKRARRAPRIRLALTDLQIKATKEAHDDRPKEIAQPTRPPLPAPVLKGTRRSTHQDNIWLWQYNQQSKEGNHGQQYFSSAECPGRRS